ncbi:hypothetical protein UFOVP1292_59 [uncultured Caudovirales phage]|uniref:Uncharacterized protein n=1 Tax=uncultured Caudovirales phage TaxID=2100421 RepID=A0A6J5PG66_9CAUD|nr:hypothetical protein UFOVP859_36 [uncultured Caudovirales phage]CAB4168491.1 hypothetical protein UFOVP882_33 [uncultured Caudovirales phage]CAB4196455.1 hypothetical protein UFOVP1292_59 [uncultured Caudovirales phage]CAB4205253.1 hypothetical protein UFOVP1411_50 [uncultured Caudovirales phage]
MLIWDEVERAIQKEIHNISSSLANGSASTIEEYRQQVGKIEGMSLSIQTMKHIIKLRLHDDTEDEE